MRRTLSHSLILNAIVATGLVLCGCTVSDYSQKEPLAAEQKIFISLDANSSHVQGEPPSQLQPETVQRRLKFLQVFVNEANSWFLPFATKYLPQLITEQQSSLVPGMWLKDANGLIQNLNQRDLAVNLLAPDWNANEAELILALRQELLRGSIERIVNENQGADARINPELQTMLGQLFTAGVPLYISSFGMPVGDTPLGVALDRKREFIETAFLALRAELDSGPDLEETLTEQKITARMYAGLWICHQIEDKLGQAQLRNAIQNGPRALYAIYLATDPAIRTTLERLPVQIAPVPDIFITH